MKNILNAIGLFLSPVIPMMAVCFFIIMVDTITGRKAARKRKEVVSSRRTRLGLVSKLLTYFAVILNEITTRYVWFDYLFTRSWTGILIWIEWTSINENIKTLRGVSLNERAITFIEGVKKIVRELMTIKQQ